MTLCPCVSSNVYGHQAPRLNRNPMCPLTYTHTVYEMGMGAGKSKEGFAKQNKRLRTPRAKGCAILEQAKECGAPSWQTRLHVCQSR